MQCSIDSILFCEKAGKPRAPGCGDNTLGHGVIGGGEHLHRSFDHDACSEPVESRRCMISKSLGRTERDGEIIGVEHFLHAPILDRPVPQKQRDQSLSAIFNGALGTDLMSPEQCAGDSCKIEVLSTPNREYPRKNEILPLQSTVFAQSSLAS